MMTLANYAIKSSKQKDPNSARALNKSLQIRNRAETSLKHCLKTHYRIPDDKRSDILNGIKEYYSRVPFNSLIWNKYQTGQCIVDSILLLDSKFNPYKALEAFKMVEKMLVNLVHLPWHKEFGKILTYSGLFRLIVSDPLVGVEEVFKAAGFELESRDTPMHLILPHNKMPQSDDGESVTSVIFDCLLAQVVMSNIIEIFENCCKASRQPGDHLRGEVNCFTWIQSYFRERTLHTSERACSNIQHQLDEVTGHLSRLEFSAIKCGPKRASEQFSAYRSSEILNHIPTKEQKDSGPSPALSAQERTRKFLAQQPIEDENLLKLSNDMLIPNYETNQEVTERQQQTDYDGPGLSVSSNRPADRGASISMVDAARQSNYLSNVYQPSQRRESSSATIKLGDSYDKTGHQQRGSNNFGPSRTMTGAEILADPMHLDPPHNDRVLLIPKQDRKYVTSQQQYRWQMPTNLKFKTNNNHDQHEYDTRQQVHHDSGPNQAASQNRHHYYDRPSCYDESAPSSHQSNQHQGMQVSLGKSSTSRYGSSTNRAKYDDISTHGRSYWPCGSCTYNNQSASEMCEMCGSRR